MKIWKTDKHKTEYPVYNTDWWKIHDKTYYYYLFNFSSRRKNKMHSFSPIIENIAQTSDISSSDTLLQQMWSYELRTNIFVQLISHNACFLWITRLYNKLLVKLLYYEIALCWFGATTYWSNWCNMYKLKSNILACWKQLF